MAAAQDAQPSPPPIPNATLGESTVNEVIVTGTRQTGIRAADSAAPIQVVGGAQLLQTGLPDLASALSTAVPSLDIQTNGADAAAVEKLVSLRGLSPNDTLVLVNGQRRHTSSNLAVDGGSIYSGSATTDLEFVPVDAIDHIEVLTDGAAAQYGSDAIAGVVNIILKKNATGGLADVTAGEDYTGQGKTESLAINQGFNLNDKGFLNVTLEQITEAHTTLGCGDLRLQNSSCQLLPQGSVDASAANLAGVVHASDYPHENQISGAPQNALYNAFYNAGYNIAPNIQLYSFGNYSYDASEHYENYRLPSKVGACIAGNGQAAGSYNSSQGTCSSGVPVLPVPDGFSPSEKFDQTDYSFTAGLKATELGWNFNLATTYGENSTKIYVINTDNASEFTTLQAASTAPVAYPTHTIYDGSFDSTEWDGKLDVDRSFAVGLAGPLNVAFGFEGRRDTFGIGPGEPESYYGGGAQSFAGYSPADDVNASRTNYAGYIDLATKPIQNLTVDIAGRYENYSDFGDTKSGKLTLRYDVSPMLAVRGTISNGFRAPTLAEEFYTGLNVGPTSVSGQLAPDSAAAKAAGFQSLKPEQSINYSAGFVLHPTSRLQITVDAYYILLHDRILPGSGFQALAPYCVPNGTTVAHTTSAVQKTCPAGQTAEDVEVAPNILNVLANQGVTTTDLTNVGVSAFLNAANTRTNGIDATATYSSDFGTFGHVDWSLGFNYNHTQVSLNSNLPSILYNYNAAIGINQTQLLGVESASDLTTGTPREKLIAQAYWRKGPWSANVRETVYNDMSEIASLSPYLDEKIGAEPVTDLDIGYMITRNVKLDVGCNNLFDLKPPIPPLSSTGQPIGANVYRVPYGFAPFGQDGGYYYARLRLNW